MAILLVLGAHFVMEPNSAGLFSPVAGLWYRIGWAGVDLFFVLSGYLVTGLLFAEYRAHGRVDLKRFLVRRGFKIWPAYFAYVGFVGLWLVAKQWQGDDAGVGELWPNLLHVQNYFGTPRVHTWSLAVEEHFYLVGALLAALWLTPGRDAASVRGFPLLGAAALATLALVRFGEWTLRGPDAVNIFATHLRFDGLLCGSLLAYFAQFERARLAPLEARPALCLGLGVALAAPTLLLTPDHSAWIAGPGLTVMYVGFGLVVIAARGWEARRAPAPGRVRRALLGAMQRIGIASYGIYLWHVDLAQTPLVKVGAAAANWGVPAEAGWLLVTGAYVFIAFVTGTVLTRLIELPMLGVRDRLFPSRLEPAPARPPAEEPSLSPAGQLAALALPPAAGRSIAPGVG